MTGPEIAGIVGDALSVRATLWLLALASLGEHEVPDAFLDGLRHGWVEHAAREPRRKKEVN